MSVKVVVSTSNGLFKTIIGSEKYKKNNIGQIVLPKGYYSAGFYERLTDSDWNTLSWLDGISMDYFENEDEDDEKY